MMILKELLIKINMERKEDIIVIVVQHLFLEIKKLRIKHLGINIFVINFVVILFLLGRINRNIRKINKLIIFFCRRRNALELVLVIIIIIFISINRL